MPTDIEIAQQCKMLPIAQIAEKAHVPEEALEPYGRYKAKIDPALVGNTGRKAKLVLVTAMTPTPAGEGKTTTTIGLSDGLSRLGGEATGGADPCHLSLWQDHLFAANYSSGSFAVFSLGGAGEIRQRTDLKIHAGHGPNPARQEGPHAHCCFPWQDFLCVCDLGLDAIFLYGLEEGKLVERTRFQAPAGSGPRHLAAHPAFPSLLYCVTELTGELLVLQPEGAELRLLRRIPMVPDNFDGLNTAAAIHFTEDGQSLLVSHRGLDAIAVFPIDARGLPGEPVLSPCVREPRDFMIAGEYVLAGSQKDHVLRAYRLDGTRLAETPWELPVHSPVCFQPLV